MKRSALGLLIIVGCVALVSICFLREKLAYNEGYLAGYEACSKTCIATVKAELERSSGPK